MSSGGPHPEGASQPGERRPHPRDVLLGAQAAAMALPVCDHYSGVEVRMRKSLELQAAMIEEFGACVFDVTLDCEDGAPVGGEKDHADMVVALVRQAQSAIKSEANARIAVRVHPVDHPAFQQDIDLIAGAVGHLLCHVMIPKVESVADVELAVAALDRAMGCASGRASAPALPVHVLVESPGAVHRAFDIAGHGRVESISFGLMDFVSAHAGAIPASALGTQSGEDGPGQFDHPLVVRAKLDIASACHAWGKVPSHCVVTEFNDVAALKRAASKATRELGFTRMWSIHPGQIRPILEVFAPSEREVEQATRMISLAQAQDWAPISVDGRLHDRASYRYYWQVLERAHRTGRAMPTEAGAWFAPAGT